MDSLDRLLAAFMFIGGLGGAVVGLIFGWRPLFCLTAAVLGANVAVVFGLLLDLEPTVQRLTRRWRSHAS